MEWVAIDVHIAGDAVTHRLADRFHLRVAEAAGLLTLTFAGMVQHARDGSLTNITDSQLEAWAVWQGKRGQFAAFFREQLCDESGVVRAWEEYNGRAIRRAEAAKARSRAYREQHERERNDARTEREQNANSTHTRTHTVRRTGPDQTVPKDLTTSGTAEPSVVRGKKPRPPAPWMGLVRPAWTLGTLPPGAATQLEPVVAAIGAEETAERIRRYCEETDPQYASIRSFVTKHAAYADVSAVDPATGLPNAAGMRALGGGRR